MAKGTNGRQAANLSESGAGAIGEHLAAGGALFGATGWNCAMWGDTTRLAHGLAAASRHPLAALVVSEHSGGWRAYLLDSGGAIPIADLPPFAEISVWYRRGDA
jgi:hypothetical protein